MKVAVIGSRALEICDFSAYLPADTSSVLSGGAKGIDRCVKQYALNTGLPITEYLPDYKRYGHAAPLIRNREIVRDADYVVAFWDGCSRGTKFVIDYCLKCNKPIKVYRF